MSSLESTTSLDKLHVGKARKKNGYYTCPIQSTNKRDPFIISIDAAQLLDVKESSSTLLLKCKDMLHYMNELSTLIVSVVELNHESWFSSSIDDAYIEEMFVAPIFYDPKHGAIFRIRIKNLEDFSLTSLVGNKVQLVIELKSMMFARQKFFLNFKLQDIQLSNAQCQFVTEEDEDVETDEEEHDDLTPSFEDVLAIKHDKLHELEEKRAALFEQVQSLSTKISFLSSCNTIPEILKACEEIADQ